MRKRRSLRDQIADRCVHFTGIQHDQCKAHVRYDDVRDTDVRPHRLPCFRSDLFETGEPAPVCTAQRFPTDAEVDAEVAEMNAELDRHLAQFAAGTCPICGGSIEPSRVVGRCKYASCGHRIGQVSDEARDA